MFTGALYRPPPRTRSSSISWSAEPNSPTDLNTTRRSKYANIRWIEEILHHRKDDGNLINTGINRLSTGARFLPSTVVLNRTQHTHTHQIQLRHENVSLPQAVLPVGWYVKMSWCIREDPCYKKMTDNPLLKPWPHQYQSTIDGGFLKLGYPQSSSISRWEFPWHKWHKP